MKGHGFLTFDVAISLLLVLILYLGISGTSAQIKSYKAADLQSRCDVIDRSLEYWSKFHRGVDEGSIVYTDKGVKYKKTRIYPKTLTELKQLQDVGYLSKDFFKEGDMGQFRYSTRDDATAYHLEVSLPTGGVYVSPRSSY